MLSILPVEEIPLRTPVALDDELVAKAQDYPGIKEKSPLLHEALTLFVACDAGLRSAAMGGSDPTATAAPRRRSEIE
jgi:Arc/MetJ family transcription regulator